VSTDTGPVGAWARATANSSLIGGVVAAIWMVPQFAAVLTIVTYLSGLALPTWFPGHDQPPAVLGPLVGLLAWIILGFIYSGFATAANANRLSYGELLARVSGLAARLANCAQLKKDPCVFSEADSHRAWLQEELGSAGVRWVTASGYITAWQRVHRAEEILVLVEDRIEVLANAIRDALRLQGSTMDHATQLQSLLASAESYIRQHVLGAAVLAPAPAVAASAANGPVPVATETEARATISEVRRAINEYRDDTWSGIVRARNQLLRALVGAEVAAYLVLELAVVMHAPTYSVVAATAFFLIGALVGLFNRLNLQSKTDTAVEDYALSTTRMIVTPIFSGIAAVIGVVLVGMLYSAGLASVIQPKVGSGTPAAIPALGDIFNLQTYPIGLVVAAIFGLTPTLVFDRLNKLTEGYKNDIKGTEAANITPKTPT
jgi:hypothetical protein